MVSCRLFFMINFIFIFTFSLQAHFHPKRVEKPLFTRGLYINAYRAGDSRYMSELTDRFKGLINTLVIDIKDSHGKLTYHSDLRIVRKVGSQGAIIDDIRGYIKKLKSEGFYIVGRIVVFRDPVFARYKGTKYGVRDKKSGKLFTDESGFVWVDPFSRKAWEYNVAIAEEAAKVGFDEIQFDYVRYPSTNGIVNARFPFQKGRRKEEAILYFLEMANEKLKRLDINVSIAVFGYSAWQKHLPREGQHFYEIGNRVDVIYPILYPSHFADDFLKNKHKEKRTYDVIYRSIMSGSEILEHTDCKLIAYIQGFDWKRSILGKDYIGVQMRAAENADSEGWIVWNAKGEYDDCYITLVEKSIQMVVPEIKGRFDKFILSESRYESKHKRYDSRGIEAVLHW